MLFKVVKLLVFLVIARHVVKMLLLMGFHKTASNHWPGPCRTVPPIEHGAEDIALTKDGLAIITSGIDITYSGDRTDPRISAAEGKLFAFDFSNPNKNATELKLGGADFEFVPHGISIWESTNGKTRLFVVNHRQDAETIEVFDLTGSVAEPILKHVKSVQDPLFTSVNDVLATGPDSFYATNDGYLRYTLWRVLERWLNLPWGSVVYHDGQTTRAVIDSRFEPNGMGISRDGRFVFIGHPFIASIVMYERCPDTNDLSFLQNIPTGDLPDNVFVHPETGDLWSGGVAIAHRHIAAVEDFDNWAPAAAIRVRPLGPKDRPFEEFKLYDVFRDDGHLMSTSSSVAVHGNKLLVGSVIHRLVYCDMKTETTLPRDVY